MHFFPSVALLLAAYLTACESPTTAATTSSTTALDSATTPSAANPAETANAQPTPKQGQYRLLGVVDSEFNMVAFALKVPRDWPAKQSYKRQWNGAMPISQVYLSFHSPDGTQQVEYLPLISYSYSDGPTRRNMEAQARSMGMELPRNPSEVAPMPALVYLKQLLLPQLAQNGLQLRRLTNERQTAPQSGPNQQTKSSASIDGVLPNGRKVRVECRMNMQTMKSNGDTFYAWQVVPSITQTSADNLAATYEKTKVAQESIVNNPAWQQRNQELMNKGMQANSEASRRNHEMIMGNIAQQGAASTAAHQARMADIQRQGAANTARHNDRMAASDQQMAAWQEKNASQDRQHEYYVDNAIRGETKYVDPSTGQRVKVDNIYNHVYTDKQGTYYGSNTPIDAGTVDWQELQRVALKNY